MCIPQWSTFSFKQQAVRKLITRPSVHIGGARKQNVNTLSSLNTTAPPLRCAPKKMEIKVVNHVDIRVRAGQLKIPDNISYVVITLLPLPLTRYRTVLWLQLNHDSCLNVVPHRYNT